MEGTRVRSLGERDIDAAIALTDLEGWGYTDADFRRLLALSPEGCFAAEREGRVVGVLTTTTYDGLAFLGAVIVRPELRGKGVGRMMMEAALEHLRGSGVRTVRLNAYLHAVRFYENLGFHGEHEVIRWQGPIVAGKPTGARPIRGSDLSPLAQFDAEFFGSSRRDLLVRLADEFPEAFLVAERGGRFQGYIVGNVSGDSCEVGPWIVAPGRTDIATNLFHGLIAATGASDIAFSGPSRNTDLLEFIRNIGYEEVFRALRMWWGEDGFPGKPAGVWALGGLEKG